MRLKNQVIDRIKSYFTDKTPVEAVYLYGSFVKERADKDSDIDIALFMKKLDPKNPFAIPEVVFSQELSSLLGKEVEIQDLGSCSLEFAHRVLSEGKLIFCRNHQKRIDFETQTIKKYFDLRPMFDEYYKSLLEIAKKGEFNVRYS